MGGQQRDVTQILAYTVQACHDTVPPEEIHGILKTIAHNFITERCTGEQMAVGINACRAICARSPSSLLPEDSNTLHDDEANGIGSSSISVDVEAFARDLAGFAKHRDRSVAVAGRSWTNFVREVHPSLLQGKDRGSTGSALHRAGEKPLRYGEQRVASGVAGADLLVEYESKKAAYLKKQMASKSQDGQSEVEDDDSEGWVDIDEGEVEDDEGWVEMDDEDDDEEVDDGSKDEDLVENDDDEYESEDNSGDEDEDEVEQAPTLVPVIIIDGKPVPSENTELMNRDKTIDLASMTPEQRAKFNEEISSSRVFTAADFEKMRKLVEREERLKRDPRAAARLKRRRAQGKEFEELSDDESEADSDADEGRVQVKGAVNTNDIMADAKRKRANKMERLEKIIAGREQFEHKQRAGGSTNTEKKRKQNFLMSKFSTRNRTKQSSKETARRGILQKTKKTRQNKHENKKRRRKL